MLESRQIMNLKIIATRFSTPEEPGFPDKCIIEDPVDAMILFKVENFGTNPNPVNPKTGLTWEVSYAQLAPGIYDYRCLDHRKFGKCLMLNDGGKCDTTRPNPNPESPCRGTYFAEAVFIHRGFRSGEQSWRGSAACMTVDPDEWAAFVGHFKFGDKGKFQLIDGTIHK
jgi:hypothetical protein